MLVPTQGARSSDLTCLRTSGLSGGEYGDEDEDEDGAEGGERLRRYCLPGSRVTGVGPAGGPDG
ncbi:MAG TPA: hypothetical protein VHO67_08390, partial [Polyangia bacterium]|nr:hypothetical protein [Polyangia bacterium]